MADRDEAHKLEILSRAKAQSDAAQSTKKGGKIGDTSTKAILPPLDRSRRDMVQNKDKIVSRGGSSSKRKDVTNLDGDVPSPRRIKTTHTSTSSCSSIALATSDSIKMGHSVSKKIPLSDADLKATQIGTVESGSQALAFTIQALLWISAQTSQALADQAKLSRLGKEAAEANERVTAMQKERDAAREKIKSAKSKAREDAEQIKELKEEMFKLKEQLEEANERALNAEVKWYVDGVRDKLKAAKEAGMDYKQLMGPYDADPFPSEEETQARSAAPEEVSQVRNREEILAGSAKENGKGPEAKSYSAHGEDGDQTSNIQ